MAAIDEAIKKLDRALELSRELHVDAERIMLHQRIIGILIGIVLCGATIWIAIYI